MCSHTIYTLLKINNVPFSGANRIEYQYQTYDVNDLKWQIKNNNITNYVNYTKKGVQYLDFEIDQWQWALIINDITDYSL